MKTALFFFELQKILGGKIWQNVFENRGLYRSLDGMNKKEVDKMIKYLGWKWYDWLLTPLVALWVIVVTMVMSPFIVMEYVISMITRQIRENRFYERHDFGLVEDSTELDDLDYQAIEEMDEEQVMGKFLYKSKMVRVWITIMAFRKVGELR